MVGFRCCSSLSGSEQNRIQNRVLLGFTGSREAEHPVLYSVLCNTWGRGVDEGGFSEQTSRLYTSKGKKKTVEVCSMTNTIITSTAIIKTTAACVVLGTLSSARLIKAA